VQWGFIEHLDSYNNDNAGTTVNVMKIPASSHMPMTSSLLRIGRHPSELCN